MIFSKLFRYGFGVSMVVISGCSWLPAHKGAQAPEAAVEGAVTLETTSGTLGSAHIKTELETTRVQVPGNLLEGFTTQITRGLDSSGHLTTRVDFAHETGPAFITLPEPEFIQKFSPTAEQFEQIQNNDSDLAVIQPLPVTEADEVYPLDHLWHTNQDYFWKTHSGLGIGNRVAIQLAFTSEAEVQSFTTTLHTSSELRSNCPLTDNECYQGRDPVLFIHGYTPSSEGLGGGEKTWKQFPNRILELGRRRVNNTWQPQYVAFEFRWITAARFEDVAADLGRAIELIAQHTGKTVHIVAHSFGGILVRTYLQNFATHLPYRGNLASVTTVGSPHSGIPKEDKVMHDILFSRGQDNQGLINGQLQIDFCQQISCYQMGQFIDFNDNALRVLKLNFDDQLFNAKPHLPVLLLDVSDELPSTDKPGKLISILADLQHYPLPKQLPIQILIGLTVKQFVSTSKTLTKIQEGDGLISFAGQRLQPELTLGGNYPSLLKADSRYGSQISEYILGFDSAPRPGFESQLPPEHPGYWGYRHSGAPVGAGSSARPMVQVECEQVQNCDHATFNRVKQWLQNYPSQRSTQSGIQLPVTIKVVATDTQQPIPFAFVRIYRRRSAQERLLSDSDPFIHMTQTNKLGIATAQIEFQPNASYYLKVNAWGYHSAEETPSLQVKDSVKNSPSHFGTVALVAKRQRGQLTGTITDGTNPLGGVNYVVYNGEIWRAGQADEQGYYAITGLFAGETQVFFLKPGYELKEVTLMMKAQQQKALNLSLLPKRQILQLPLY